MQMRLNILPPNFHPSVRAATAINIDKRTEGILFLEVFCVRSAVGERGQGIFMSAQVLEMCVLRGRPRPKKQSHCNIPLRVAKKGSKG
jgi:hypothetical protein